MRALIIGPEQTQEIRRVVEHAERNYYEPGMSLPGDDPAFVVHVPDGFRCVFTITRYQGQLYRHLTVSVPDPEKYPSPEATVVLAKEFGFTASDGSLEIRKRVVVDGWMASPGHEGEHCIVVIQPLEA